MRGATGHRHLILLICILLLFIISPIVVRFHHGVVVLNIVAATVLLAGSYALSTHKYPFAIAIGLSVVSVILTWRLSVAPSHGVVITSHISILLLNGVFAVTILSHVLRAGRIDADKIYAAICVYFLMGYAWAFGYSLLVEMQTDAFTMATPFPPGDYIGRVMQLRYFSFVTLTTMGYGDIVPRSPGARTMATLEAVMGQLYLVALIGRLIGLHIAGSGQAQAKER